MIFFWAIVDESDVESYAKSLTLPPYMSHLSMESFHFDRQVRNTTGKELIVIRYISDGRLEEYSLHPFDHAKLLIASLDSKIDPSKIEINLEDAIWNWGETNQENILQGQQVDSETNRMNLSIEAKSANKMILADKRIMRVFFETVPQYLSQKSLRHFSPQDAYVSVSRSELFISQLVIRHYLLMRCLAILKNNPYQKDFFCESGPSGAHSVSKVSAFQHSLKNADKVLKHIGKISDRNSDQCLDDLLSSLILEKTNGGFCFRFGNIGGKYLVGDEKILNDLILFAGLDQSLKYVSEFVKIDIASNKPELEEGLRLQLSRV